MTTAQKLRAAASLPEIEIFDPGAEDIYKGEQQENTRMMAILEQALAVIEIQGAALKEITGPMKGKGCRFVAREALARVAKILAEEK